MIRLATKFDNSYIIDLLIDFQKFKYSATFNIDADGTYSKKWTSQSGGILMSGIQNGRVYRCGNVVALMDEDPEEWTNFFWIKSDHQWVPEWIYKDEPFNMLAPLQ